MNRYKLHIPKPTLDFIDLGSVWEINAAGLEYNKKYPREWPYNIVVREPNYQDFWVCRVDPSDQAALDREKASSNMYVAVQNIEAAIQAGQRWRYSCLYAAYRTSKSKENIKKYYNQIDQVDYLFGGTNFS